jgi:hypothetical protein
MGEVMTEEIKRLEGEIDKRDARIAELEDELCERVEELEYAIADLNNALAELAAIREQVPVAARQRFRHPQKNTPDWSIWHPAPANNDRPRWFVDSVGYEVEYQPLYAAPVVSTDQQRAPVEWRNMDPSAVIETIRRTTVFDADMIGEMLTYAINAAAPAPGDSQ